MRQVERKAKPILFTGPNVVKIMRGLKTQTRRIMNNPEYYGCPTGDCPHQNAKECYAAMNWAGVLVDAPFKVGDFLWVRETWWEIPEPSEKQLRDGADTWPKVAYNADESEISREQNREMGWKLRPSIFMPRWASRVTLEVTQVRAERVGDISEEDAQAEGVEEADCEFCADLQGAAGKRCNCGEGYWENFKILWDSINKKPSCRFADNPYVWAYTFRRIQ